MVDFLEIKSLKKEEQKKILGEINKRIEEKKKKGVFTDKEIQEIIDYVKPLVNTTDSEGVVYARMIPDLDAFLAGLNPSGKPQGIMQVVGHDLAKPEANGPLDLGHCKNRHRDQHHQNDKPGDEHSCIATHQRVLRSRVGLRSRLKSRSRCVAADPAAPMLSGLELPVRSDPVRLDAPSWSRGR